MNKEKKLSVKEVRNKLHKLEYELHKHTGKNKLTSQYRIKVAYMLMWMRLIRINKNELKGWHMPDMNTITKITPSHTINRGVFNKQNGKRNTTRI